MGRAKKTRKYAATKRVLNPNDDRLKLKAAAKDEAAPIVHRDSDKKKGAADASVQRSELFFSHNRALGPPFHVRLWCGCAAGEKRGREGGGAGLPWGKNGLFLMEGEGPARLGLGSSCDVRWCGGHLHVAAARVKRGRIGIEAHANAAAASGDVVDVFAKCLYY